MLTDNDSQVISVEVSMCTCALQSYISSNHSFFDHLNSRCILLYMQLVCVELINYYLTWLFKGKLLFLNKGIVNTYF